MIKLEVEAPTVSALRVELAALLNGLGHEAPVAVPGCAPPLVQRAEKDADESSQDEAPSPAATSDAPPVKRGRGRPPKSAATGSPTATGYPPAAKEPEQAPLPLEAQATTGPAESQTASTPVVANTFDQVKAKLQAVAARDGGKGLADATKIIHEFGYVMIKAIKSEHYDAIAAKCDALLGA